MPKPPTEARVPRSEKVAFILSQDPDLRAREVVKLARLQGLNFSEQRVYAVRSLARNQSEKRISKTSFVLGLSDELSAREVVRHARENGLEISEDQVHTIRWAARRKARLAGTGVPFPPLEAVPTLPSKRRAAETAKEAPQSAATSAEKRLRHLIAEVGLTRARQLLEEVDQIFVA